MGRVLVVLAALVAVLVGVLEFGRRSSFRSSPMDFRGKTVLVTGSSGGLGQQLALDLCKKGAHLILVARRKTELEKTKQSCVAAGGASATVFVTDMNNTDSMKLLIASLSSTKLDVLLLNHGVGAVKRFVDYTERDFDLAETLFRINFHSYTRLVHGLLPNLNRDASVVAIGSMAGAVPGLYRTTYSPAKYALRSLWAGLRLELGEERGLFFTHVLPGYVLTDLHDVHFIGGVKRRNLPLWMSKEEASSKILFGIARGDREVRLEWLHEVSAWLFESIVFTTNLVDNLLRRVSMKNIELNY